MLCHDLDPFGRESLQKSFGSASSETTVFPLPQPVLYTQTPQQTPSLEFLAKKRRFYC